MALDANEENAPVDFLIPSGADFDRFSELIDQVLLLRKRDSLNAKGSSSGSVESKSVGEEINKTKSQTTHEDEARLEGQSKPGSEEVEPVVEAMSASTMLRPDEFEF